MSIGVPPRPYLTFSELVSRWGRRENSLQYAIIAGELKPSMWVPERWDPIDWQEDQRGRWKHRLRNDVAIQEQANSATVRLVYLQDPIQTGPFDCQFQLACDTRDPTKSLPHFDLWHVLRPPVSMSDVMTKAVFTMYEIEQYERKFKRQPTSVVAPAVQQEKRLATTERNTLLTIIAVLCHEAKLDYNTASKTSDLIESSAASLGISIGATSIRDHLKNIPNALGTRTR